MSRVAVVGRGLIGAAAARHLALMGQEVTLIGPGEPADRAAHQGVFASHYDEGRITRLLDPHPVWAELAAASIARYGEIAAAGGIGFFTEAGFLGGAPEGYDYLNKLRAMRDQRGIPAVELRGVGLAAAFPDLRFDADLVLLHQRHDAGHVSPRKLVAAQTAAAQAAGARLIAAEVRQVADGRVVLGDEAQDFDAVLVACGAFSNGVLPAPLDLTVYGRTVTFFELAEAQAARLAHMPSLIFETSDGREPYILPPILYPDGRYYLKIGGDHDDMVLRDAEAAHAWFRSAGRAEVGLYHKDQIDRLLGDVQYTGIHTESCAVTYTPTGLPMIGAVTPGLTVAVGGCGGAAKSSDEIGRIAALAVLGEVDDRFPVAMKKT